MFTETYIALALLAILVPYAFYVHVKRADRCYQDARRHQRIAERARARRESYR